MALMSLGFTEYEQVLVLAGVEFVFFIVAHIMIYFGFVTRTVITHRCLSYCWAVLAQHQGLFCFLRCPGSKDAGGAQETETGQARWPGQVTPSDQSDIPCHMTSCLAIKDGEKEKGRQNIWSHGIYLPKLPLRMMEPCFSGSGWTSACWWEAVNEFLILFCFHIDDQKIFKKMTFYLSFQKNWSAWSLMETLKEIHFYLKWFIVFNFWNQFWYQN